MSALGSYRDSANANIWTSGDGWTPIGGQDAADRFNGAFDGNGHAITGLLVNSDALAIGLFGSIGTDGVVHSLNLVDARVRYTGDSTSATLIGSLAGLLEGSVAAVSASGANGAVDGSGTNLDHAGGLVGYNTGTITSSYATITVDGGSGGGNRVGGLVGRNLGTIIASYATGAVRSGDGHEDSVGGLVGFSDDLDGFGGTIIASYATGAVSDSGGDENAVGGLVGQNLFGGTITASYAIGNATAGGGDTDYVGGLVGYQFFGDAVITASYATGNATGGGGGDDVGRLVGYNDSGASAVASYGFGNTANGNTTSGIDRSSGDTSGATDVPDATALTTANSSTDAAQTWSTAVWNFGGSTQSPALMWVTASDGGAAAGNADDTYSCDATLLPTGQSCGGIIPGQ